MPPNPPNLTLMEEKDIYKKLHAIHKEVRDLNNKLNLLFAQQYGVGEVAAELRLARGSVYKIDPLKLPYFKRGKFRVYKKEDVLEYKKSLEY